MMMMIMMDNDVDDYYWSAMEFLILKDV